MMKFLNIIGLLFISSSIAMAEDNIPVETCANGAGTIIVGAITGHKYCKSNKTMNWWNAVSWCEGLNKRLFNFDDCKCDTTTDCRICPELVTDTAQNTSSWIYSACNNQHSLRVDTNTGALWSASYGIYCTPRMYSFHAICL